MCFFLLVIVATKAPTQANHQNCQSMNIFLYNNDPVNLDSYTKNIMIWETSSLTYPILYISYSLQSEWYNTTLQRVIGLPNKLILSKDNNTNQREKLLFIFQVNCFGEIWLHFILCDNVL